MTPILICMTPVRNEAWCLDVFLRATSLWADYIIIVDQNSTDGSKEIARKYEKVIFIDNNEKEYNEATRQNILIQESRKITGSKILFALDADEVFTGNFQSTTDWQRIINSKPGEVFGFQWANILPDQKHYFTSPMFFPWVMHDDGTEHKNHVKDIHSMRIPYPSEADMGYYHIKDFKVFHFSYLYKARVQSKIRFYQCYELIKGHTNNSISSYRSYHSIIREKFVIPEEWLQIYNSKSISIFNELNLSENIFWFDYAVINIFRQYDIKQFKYLYIWQSYWLKKVHHIMPLDDPRTFSAKLFHFYLEVSQRFYPSIFIKAIDKLLKCIY